MRDAHAMIKDGLLRTITPDQVRACKLLLSFISILRMGCAVVVMRCDAMKVT